MKKRVRLSAVFLLLVFCLSFAGFSVYATDEEGGEDVVITDNQDLTYEEETDPPYEEETDPPYEETDPPYEEDEQTDAPYNGGEDSDDNSGEEDYDTPDDNDYNSGDDGSDDYNYDTVEEYYEDNADEFQDYNDNAAETAAPTEPVYKVSGKTDTKLLNDDDWSDIAAKLSNSAGGGDDIDFGDIQKDTSIGDDKSPFFYFGIVLLVLGVLGGAFVAGWYIMMNSKLRKVRPAVAGASGNRPVPPTKNSSPKMNPKTADSKRQVKKRSKFDTGEVQLPNSKSNGRYKPRH